MATDKDRPTIFDMHNHPHIDVL